MKNPRPAGEHSKTKNRVNEWMDVRIEKERVKENEQSVDYGLKKLNDLGKVL